MTIRWGNGLFRAWLLATVLWIGFAGWAEMRSIPYHGELSDADVGIGTTPVAPPPFNPNLPIDTGPTWDNTTPIGPLVGKPVTDPAILAQLNAPDNPASKLSMVTMIFGPPLFVLIFGCALWWVFRGFKPQES